MSLTTAIVLSSREPTAPESRLLQAEIRYACGDVRILWATTAQDVFRQLAAQVDDVLLLTEQCWLRGARLGAWCTDMLERARGGVISADSELDIYDKQLALQQACLELGIDVPGWVPGQVMNSPHFCVLGATTVATLADAGWLIRLANSAVFAELPPLCWLGLLAQFAGQYRIGVGTAIRPMFPLLLLPDRPGYLAVPPQFLSPDVWVYAPLRNVVGYSEHTLRKIAQTLRGEESVEGWVKQQVTIHQPEGVYGG